MCKRPATSNRCASFGPVCFGSTSSQAHARASGRWEDLALNRHLDEIVVDETGLSGWLAALLEWSGDSLGASLQATASTPSDRPELFTALREQLEKAERPIEVIVIDSVERPTPN